MYILLSRALDPIPALSLSVSVCVSVSVSAFVSVYVYAYIHTHTNTCLNKHTYRCVYTNTRMHVTYTGRQREVGVLLST